MEPIVPESSTSGGNTKSPSAKQISPARHWCFTFNNYTETDLCSIVPILKNVSKKYIFQEETGEQGTRHLQGYVEFKNKVRPKGLLPDAVHWEKTRNIKQSIDYCQKQESRTGKVYRFNIEEPFTMPYSQFDLYLWEKFVLDYIRTEPNDRELLWIYSDEGNVGKTTFQKLLYLNEERVVILSGKAHDMKASVAKYYEEHGFTPKIIIVNYPRSTGLISYTGLEELKDMLFFSGKYETHMICGRSPHVIIFANREPDYNMMSSDR